MEPIADIRSREKGDCNGNRDYPSSLKFLVDLTTDEATLYSVDFSLSRSNLESGPNNVQYSVTLCKSPFHSWCQTAFSPHQNKGIYFFQFRGSESRIEDSDLPLQIAQALGRIPGLAYVKFSYRDRACHHYPFSLNIDNSERVVPLFLESICAPRSTSVLKQLELHITSTKRYLSTSLPLTSAICTVEILQIRHIVVHKDSIQEDDARRIASFLRTNKSLKYLDVTFDLVSWQISSALEIMLEPLTLSRINGIKGGQHKDGDHVLQKLNLGLEFDNRSVNVDPVETMKIMTLMLDAASSVGQLCFTIKTRPAFRPRYELIMRMEHGALVELHVPVCNDIGADVVEEALRLNRGPRVLSLGPLLPLLIERLLCVLIPDQRHERRANTCVSTLKLLNLSWAKNFSTLKLQQERLEHVADILETNSTVKHLKVNKTANKWWNVHPPQLSPDSLVVARLQSTSTCGRNLQSFTFYGEELCNCSSSTAASNQNADGDVKKQQGKNLEVEVEKVEKVEVPEAGPRNECGGDNGDRVEDLVKSVASLEIAI